MGRIKSSIIHSEELMDRKKPTQEQLNEYDSMYSKKAPEQMSLAFPKRSRQEVWNVVHSELKDLLRD